MTPITTANDIEQQLAALRSNLTQDVHNLASEARQLVDWRYHFRAHPWLICGGVAAAGCWFVLRRQRPDWVETAIVTNVDGQQTVATPLVAETFGTSFVKTMARVAATTVARESLGYLMQRIRRDSP